MPTMPYMIALIRFLWIPYLVIAVWAGLVGSWWQCGVAVAGIVSILAMQVLISPKLRFSGSFVHV